MLNLKKTILFPKNNEAYSILKLFQSYYILFTVNTIYIHTGCNRNTGTKLNHAYKNYK